jgi:hypothetical protein
LKEKKSENNCNTWQIKSPISVKIADVKAFTATGYFARRAKYL